MFNHGLFLNPEAYGPSVSPGAFELTEMGKQAIVDCITDPQNDHLYDDAKRTASCNDVSKSPTV